MGRGTVLNVDVFHAHPPCRNMVMLPLPCTLMDVAASAAVAVRSFNLLGTGRQPSRLARAVRVHPSGATQGRHTVAARTSSPFLGIEALAVAAIVLPDGADPDE